MSEVPLSRQELLEQGSYKTMAEKKKEGRKQIEIRNLTPGRGCFL